MTFRKLNFYPDLERVPDLNRYETRLAADVALTLLLGEFIPGDQHVAFQIAQQRAFRILGILAKGG